MQPRFRIFLAALGLCVLASAAQAQTQLSPRLSHIAPLGGQAGSTFELKVTGQDITDVEGLHFNFPGVKVETGSSDKVAAVEMGKKGVKPVAGLTQHRFTVTLPPNAPLGIQDVRIVTKAG